MITEPQAKAVEQVAKSAGLALDTTQRLGAFLGRMFGTVPEDVVGVLGGDWLHHVRMRNAARLAARTEDILIERGILNTTKIVSPTVALPLLRAAQDESRDEVSELWASLLANAMDPERSQFVERWVITTLGALEPVDALVLQFVNVNCQDIYKKITFSPDYFIENICKNFSEDSVLLSVTRLTDEWTLLSSGLLTNLHGSSFFDKFKFVSDQAQYERSEYVFQYTAKGRQFVRACLPSTPNRVRSSGS